MSNSTVRSTTLWVTREKGRSKETTFRVDQPTSNKPRDVDISLLDNVPSVPSLCCFKNALGWSALVFLVAQIKNCETSTHLVEAFNCSEKTVPPKGWGERHHHSFLYCSYLGRGLPDAELFRCTCAPCCRAVIAYGPSEKATKSAAELFTSALRLAFLQNEDNTMGLAWTSQPSSAIRTLIDQFQSWRARAPVPRSSEQ
jgi:hypothetical protein